MKRFFTTLLFTLIFVTNIFSQKGTIKIVKPHLSDSVQSKTLIGYFIVSCFDTTIKNNCDLYIKTIKDVSGDSMTCGDGNFYKNISTIMYVKTTDLDLNKIDDFNYQIKLQAKEQNAYLSINPLILLDASKRDSSVLKNNLLVKSIEQNQITAELIQKQIENFKLFFKIKKHYYILLRVSIKVIALPPRIKPVKYKDPMGIDQYIILWDKKNEIEGVKVIQDPF